MIPEYHFAIRNCTSESKSTFQQTNVIREFSGDATERVLETALDGNGRIGWLLLTLLMCNEKRCPSHSVRNSTAAIVACLAVLLATPLFAANNTPDRGLKVLPDKAPDCSSLKSIVETTTPDEKAIVIYNFVRLTQYHSA